MIYDIINEGKIDDKADKVKSEIVVFYEHIFKWKYKNALQCSSWTLSIFRSIWKAEKNIGGNKNIRIRSNKLIKEAYKLGASKASAFCKVNILKIKDNAINEFSDIDSVLNKDLVKKLVNKLF